MRDLRDKLPRAQWEIGHRNGPPLGATLHYNGPPVGAAGNPAAEQAQLAIDARYHMRPDLIGGDGIQYHYAILSNGDVCQLRNETAILWHTANGVGNNTHLGIHLPLGGAQDATARQWQATIELFDQLIARYGWPGRSAILGHREWPRSDGKPQKSCPGPILFRRLQLWRGQLEPAAGQITYYTVKAAIATANIRQGPATSYRIAGQAHAGDTLEIDAIVAGGRWAHLASGLGFIAISLLEPAL